MSTEDGIGDEKDPLIVRQEVVLFLTLASG